MATHDTQVQCARDVELHEARDDSAVPQLAMMLPSLLQLKKEIGNARLVSGDAMLWVGDAKLTQRDVGTGERSAKEYRLKQGKRAFVFTLDTTPESKQFVDELKEQIEGKAGLDVRRKKRKIRKQVARAMGFVPVNTLKTPAKPPATPTKLPTSASKPPRLAKPLDISVASVPADAYPSYPSPSPSKSPFRSPFRKKPATPRQIVAPLSPSLTDPRITASPRVREWLSPVGALKMKSEQSTPDSRRQSLVTPNSGGSTGRQSADPSPRPANKRVRSLQGLLDDVPRDTQPLLTPPKPELTPSKSTVQLTPAKRAAEVTPPKQSIVSHYFANKARKNELVSSAGSSSSKSELSPSVSAADASKHATDSQGEATSRESTQDIEELFDGGVAALAQPVNRHLRGLLNLGNYCYMNSIVQAVTKLPDFVEGVQNQEWLHSVIRKQLGAEAVSANSMTLDHVRALVDSWKDSDEDKSLALHSALEDVMTKIVSGGDTPINPEPIKHVMGRKNAIFATHFQQDAHEFLLNLVNEYEKELLNAAKSAVAKVKQEAASASTAAAPKKSSLLNFFRSEPKQDAESSIAAASVANEPSPPPSSAEEDDLVSELLPAKCFRAELFRTLTCSECSYSRKQVERFYDFSLDLPLTVSLHDSAAATAAAREKPSKRQCFCDADAAVRNTITERIYYCASGACSFQEKVATEIAPDPSSEPNDHTSADTKTSDGEPRGFPHASLHPPRATILLDSLMRKQFESETLELSCEKCERGKQAVAAYAVKSLPPVIVLHLKRFEVDFKTGKLYKRCDLVEAPTHIRPKHVIVGDTVEGDEQPYELVSVVHHLGRSIDEGHYVADVREREGEWMRRNDTHESAISEDYALRASRSQESCYMFFYVRADTLAENQDKENLRAELAGGTEDTEKPAPSLAKSDKALL